jgi:hypothetical protein
MISHVRDHAERFLNGAPLLNVISGTIENYASYEKLPAITPGQCHMAGLPAVVQSEMSPGGRPSSIEV